jgi:nucleoside-diphosphate-sugar epimerase
LRILITGAAGNVGKGLIPRLREAGHDLVLHDLTPLPDTEPFAGLPFVQGDIQIGSGLERATQGCDLIVHTPAWHGIHSNQRTEIDFWRLNVDGTFWMFQAAAATGVKRVLFLSSLAWHGHYDKYGFTKRIGEELCEYYRRNHDISYVAVRPADFTPWGTDWVNRYGARLLYGGVDRDDALDCIELAVARLGRRPGADAEPEAIVANAVRANAFTEEEIAGWERDPLAACERVFPGSRPLVEKYAIDIGRKPSLAVLGDGGQRIGYAPKRHFGTFLDALGRLDAQGGRESVAAMRCLY